MNIPNEDRRIDAFYGDENYENKIALECDVCGRGILEGEDYSHFYELNEDVCDDCMYDIIDASRRQA